MLHRQKFYPFTLEIDGEPVSFRIARLTRDQLADLQLAYKRHLQLTAAAQRALERRAKDAGASPGELVSDEIAALTAEERATRDAVEKAENERLDRYTLSVIEAYVTAEPDAIEDEGVPVVTGAELCGTFEASAHVLADLHAAVLLENTLDADDKKKLRLLRASARSWPAPPEVGAIPAPTAASVASEASASPAAATDGPSPPPSGSMATSS